MDWGSRLVAGIAFILLVLFAGFSPVASFGGDGNSSFQPAPDCDNPIGVNNSCWNDNDDNSYDGTDTSDKACVKPIGPCVPQSALDRTEGNIWDTDMSAILAETGPESSKYMSEGVMFKGTLYRGPSTSSNTMNKEDSGTGTLTEYYIDEARPERPDPNESEWAFGDDLDQTVSDSDLSFGDKVKNGRVIYDPSPLQGKGESNPESCGDGLENLDPSIVGDGVKGPGSPDSDPGESTYCKEDYGQIYEKYFIKNPYDDKGQTNMQCRDQVASCSGGACGVCGSSCTSASCTVDTSYSDDPDNEFWQIKNNDVIYKKTCDVNSCSGSASDSDCQASASCSIGSTCCQGGCGPYGNQCCNSDSCNWDDAAGDDREWSSDKINYDCNQQNTVDGGTSSSSNAVGTRNDQSATYTEFTAYSDDSWGGSTNEDDGKVWCAYEFTTTVDADGPKGQGDGFIVVENRNSNGKYTGSSSQWSIIGTEAHNGQNQVGRRAYVDGSRKTENLLDDVNIDLSCNGREVCIKYVDFWTRDSGWTTTNDGGWKDAVKADVVHTLTPDQGYSVCKNINRIAMNLGSASGQVVRCDYMRDGNRISPLNEACGDDPAERLIAEEGIEVDEPAMDQYPALQQECYQYPSDPDDVDTSAGNDDVDASQYGSGGPGSSSTSGELGREWISRVDMGNIGKSSGADTDDGYQDFTSGETATLEKGGSRRIYLTFGMDAQYPEKARVWVDFDRDGNLESGERTNFGINEDISNGEQEFTDISVPSSAVSGYTLMRVSIRYQDPPPATTTSSWTYGETEDYSVRIVDSSSSGSGITTGACVADGEVYPEGTVLNVPAPRDNPNERVGDGNDFTVFESGGSSHDKEVCLNINRGISENGDSGSDLGMEADDLLEWKYPRADGDRDKGGEWWDIDNWRATEYIRNHNLDSKDYQELWMENPDENASNNPGITGVQPEYTSEKGMALEDDCAATISDDPSDQIRCEDRGPNTGRLTPVFARFSEGAKDDDHDRSETWLEVGLQHFHNRVQTGGNTGHEDDQPISQKTMSVDSTSEWDQGTEFLDTDAHDGFLDTTESVGSADREGISMGGINVFGRYTSRVFDKQPETVFTKIRVLNQFSGGDHPLVVQYASDQQFTQDTSQDVFYLNDTYNSENFSLSASQDQRYLRFRIGIGPEEVPSQVAFVVDETGSMGDIQDQIQTRAKNFFDSLGPNSEGAVIGIKEDYPDNAKVYQSFTTDSQQVKNAIDNLDANGGEEATYEGISDALGLDWDAGKSSAIIYVQDGNGCTCDRDPYTLRQELENKNITFYAVESGSTWHQEIVDLVSYTNGRHWDTPGDWDQILSEIRNDLTKLPDEPLVDRVEITASTPPDPGTGNTQDDEPLELAVPGSSEYLEWYDNAEIDPEDDEWAYTPNLQWGVANNGTAWPPGACHGAPRQQGVDKKKEDATYANSYIQDTYDVWDTGFSSNDKDGDWINPDRTDQSVRRGGVTCDLTGKDWGYAVQNNSASGVECLAGSCTATGNPASPGTEGVENSIPHEIVVEIGDLGWDKDTNPGDKDQNDLRQWKQACGDDRNEYLIREHAAKLNGEYTPTFAGRDNYYACADRPTDCVINGEVYSEGQLVDVSDVSTETGVQSEDEEICLDKNPNLPGGEWWDVDNEDIRDDIIGTGVIQDPEVFVREGDIEADKPYKIFWQNRSTQDAVRDEALREAKDSPYSPLGSTNFYGKGINYWRGYALEDDCDSGLNCDDTGVDESRGTDGDPTSNLIYSPFREAKNNIAVKVDDYSTQSTWAVRMYVSGSSSHGSGTGQAGENTNGINFDSTDWGPGTGWPTSGLNDSDIDSGEDTWAVASETYDAVGPTGAVYSTGQCHGKNPPQHSEGWIWKNETVMANSFAKREDVNSDPEDEGNWVDPDTTERTVSRGGLTCDLNSTDWGIGYDTGGSTLNVYEGDARGSGYEIDDRHAVSGPITFDESSDPLGGNQDNLNQHPSACGDDAREYLIREQRTYRGNEMVPELNNRDDIYVCADRINDCAYNGRVFSEGQTADLSRFSEPSTDPESGENISDEEVCLDLNKKTPGGEWYDKDQDLTVQNRIVGLKDTFDVSSGSNGYGDTFTLIGKVVGEGGGYLDINGRVVSVDSTGRFNEDINLIGGTTQVINYNKNGEVLARKRINLPATSSATLKNIVIAPELMYNGSEVWDNIEHFRDHDFGFNPGTDWMNQSVRYDRRDLAYFSNQGQGLSAPAPTPNVRGVYTSYYSPEGYATEDDCGPLLSDSGTGPCGDRGGTTQDLEWFSAGNFTNGGPP